MTATNDITGDKIKSKIKSKAYQENYDKIFRSKKDDNCTDVLPEHASRNIQLSYNKSN